MGRVGIIRRAMFIGAQEIAGRLLIAVEGTVVSSQTTTGNRPVTYYVIHGSDGTERKYTAGPTDKSLPGHMPTGTYLRKSKYEISYIRNGQVVNDFPWGFYVGALVIGLILGVRSLSQWRKTRRRS
jgi:hypothetical protein